MRLAFVDNLSVGGGISRYSLLLCKSLKETFPSLSIDYFVHNDNIARIPELRSIAGVKVRLLKSSVTPSYIKRKVLQISNAIRSAPISDRILVEVEARVNRNYDVAFFPSAHLMERPDISIPVVGTIHDFNWKYFFGTQIFNQSFVEVMDSEIVNWMENGLTISPSAHTVDEAKRFYPNLSKYPTTIPSAVFVVNKKMTDKRVSELLRKAGVHFPFIIFPGNFFPHKNHLNLFAAFSLLKQRKDYRDLKLVLTGVNSEQVGKGIAGYGGVRLVDKSSGTNDFDTIGMGYQPNEVMDALISKAWLLVSPSIYEGTCAPAMDAWNFGIPTAISDIAPFKEAETRWGVKTAFFDPMNPKNIADVIEAYLNNYDRAKQDALISQSKIEAYTWEKVATRYMDVFKQAVEKN